MVDPSELEQALQALCASGPIEVRENGVRLASLTNFEYEVRSQGRGTLLHVWSGERTLARRTLVIAEKSPERLVVEVEHFGRTKPDRLEFATTRQRSEGQLTREKFMGYVSTWSAVSNAKQRDGIDLVVELSAALKPVWPAGDGRTMRIDWPIGLRVGRRRE